MSSETWWVQGLIYVSFDGYTLYIVYCHIPSGELYQLRFFFSSATIYGWLMSTYVFITNTLKWTIQSIDVFRSGNTNTTRSVTENVYICESLDQNRSTDPGSIADLNSQCVWHWLYKILFHSVIIKLPQYVRTIYL